MTPATARARERLAQRLVDRRGMHPQTARNVIQHVAEHGTASPWAREVQAHAMPLMVELYGEAAREAFRRAAPMVQQLLNALRAAGRRDSYALAPPPEPEPDREHTDRPAWASPYGPPPRRRT